MAKIIHKEELNFNFTLSCSMNRDLSSHIREPMTDLLHAMGSKSMRGSVVAMVYELVINAIRTVQLGVLFSDIVEKTGDAPDRKKLYYEYHRDLEETGGKRIRNLCEAEKKSIEINGKAQKEYFEIEIRNPGMPGVIDIKSIYESIQQAEQMGWQTFHEESERDPIYLSGLGLALVINRLKEFGLSTDYFQFKNENSYTSSVIRIPWRLFRRAREKPLRITSISEKEVMADVKDLALKLGYGVIVLNAKSQILSISKEFLRHVHVPESQADEFQKLIPARFWNEFMHGPNGILKRNAVHNYRVLLLQGNGSEQLFNVSGYRKSREEIVTLWHSVLPGTHDHEMGSGSILDSLRVHSLIEPYIPAPVLQKAMEIYMTDVRSLPDEKKNLTVFFADLEGFTTISEKMDPAAVVRFLNIALGVCIEVIDRRKGLIDKFMGDAVMALFPDPLQAVIAGMEIQYNFRQLNRFRVLSGEDPLRIRIGIYTGNVIVGNIGSDQRKDWTPIGDVVNTAARIEREADSGMVLIGGETFAAIKDRVVVSPHGSVILRGKENSVEVYAVDQVSVETESGMFWIKSEDEDDEEWDSSLFEGK